jgi:hypothetical protein
VVGLRAFLAGMGAGIVAAIFQSNEFLVPTRGFLNILSTVAKPSGTLSANDFRCDNLVTSVSDRPVGVSGFIVKVSGAKNSKFVLDSDLKNFRKIFLINQQFTNLALSKINVAGTK